MTRCSPGILIEKLIFSEKDRPWSAGRNGKVFARRSIWTTNFGAEKAPFQQGRNDNGAISAVGHSGRKDVGLFRQNQEPRDQQNPLRANVPDHRRPDRQAECGAKCAQIYGLS